MVWSGYVALLSHNRAVCVSIAARKNALDGMMDQSVRADYNTETRSCMKLYFLRHGVAEEARAGMDDALRELTAEGRVKIEAEARKLRRLDLQLDALLTSPLARARQTAEIIAETLDISATVVDQLALGCNLRRLNEVLAGYSPAARVMLVGHEPDFSETIHALTGGWVVMKKGSLALVEARAIEPGAGMLHWLLPPKALRI
jgi:phosphohistidine phosphatase